MTSLRWRWSEKDFGFRFRSGGGRAKVDYYQAAEPGAFYLVPEIHRKLDKDRFEELVLRSLTPTSPRIVPSPWHYYDRDWDWITTDDGVLLNYAGCPDREEINRREDEGVARAMEFVARLLDRPEPVALSATLVGRVHVELMGAIYPFAGEWRHVALHKGEGPTKWPLPPGGIGPLVDIFERDVLSRSPFLSEDDGQVFSYASEMMCEFLALHPFREGNGRTAFTLANLLLMQNDLLPLDVYDRHKDESRYFSACEAGRVHKDYAPLAALIAEWEAAAGARWEGANA
jgi:cell filamentation protein